MIFLLVFTFTSNPISTSAVSWGMVPVYIFGSQYDPLTMPVESPLPCQFWKTWPFLETSERSKEMETTSLQVSLRLQTFVQSRSATTYWSNGVKAGHFSTERAKKNIKHGNTYINRENTNEEVYRRANAEARTDNAIRPLSQVLQEKRIKLLGHIVRRPREHPQHQMTFYTRSLIPRTVDKRRVGRPRLSWTHETMKVAWNTSQGYPFNVQDQEMRLTLQEMAQNRIPPFD